ncbi:hypothetical protein [Caulobacter sp. 602-1]|uniref:hypothetical protein n=1 Tax=Caulobacter sp. 602-1 TaxID=2492472 RepID=UPI000F63E514|nr:hypothetical protein [Caulobacter sp. 602-1]RRN64662.1 hypothetical protein EIK80_11545 [Caulobacter sp. 602-1]
MTAPFTPSDCDLRDFPRMSIDVPRLFASSFNATASRNPIAWMIGHKLWYRAWHQVPAASLPDDDDELCHLAELGFDVKTFRKVKAVAMRGWIKADDGRLYHPVIAEAALISWLEKLLQRVKSGLGNAKRWKVAFDGAALEQQIRDAAAMLSARNPLAPVLAKDTVMKCLAGIPLGSPLPSLSDPTGTPDDPTGIPTGTEKAGNSDPSAIPRERERERELKEEGSSLRSEPDVRASDPILAPTLALDGAGCSLVPAEAGPRRSRPAKPTPSNITADERGEFESWWAVYPHKVSKQAALLAFANVLRFAGVAAPHLSERAQLYGEWLRHTGTLPANGATWLNGRRWEDDLDFSPRQSHQPRHQWSSMDDAMGSMTLED